MWYKFHSIVPQGQLSETWAPVTKAAIAEAILNLTKLGEKYRDPQVCLKTPTVSLIQREYIWKFLRLNVSQFNFELHVLVLSDVILLKICEK